jgi:hypothetical protein
MPLSFTVKILSPIDVFDDRHVKALKRVAAEKGSAYDRSAAEVINER